MHFGLSLTSLAEKLPVPFFADHCRNNDFFFLPHWYKYLATQHDALGNCEITNFDVPTDFLAVGIAVIEMLLRIGGFVAVIAVIAAGVRYMTAGGNPEKAASARKSLYYAIAGLFIVLTAVAVVAFIGGALYSP